VASGASHALALRSDGTIVAWGNNDRGQLNVPSLRRGLHYVAIAAAYTISAALVSDGSARFWGLNAGEITATLPTPPPGRSYTKIATGDRHALILRDDGILIGLGDNTWGQCNIPILPAGVTFVDIATNLHSLGLLSNGEILAWGQNVYFQCNVPPLPQGTRYTQVGTTATGSMALRSDGKLIYWGDPFNFNGSLPEAPPNHHFTDVTVGSGHALGLDSSGTLQHWGSSAQGSEQIPLLPPGVRYTSCAASIWHNIALRSDGTAVAWGNNHNGRCDVPPLPAGMHYQQVACSYGHSAVLRSDGNVLAFGSNVFGESTIPPLPPNTRYVEVACGERLTLLRRSDGVLIARGGAQPDRRLNLPSPPAGVEYLQVAVAEHEGGALRSDGLVDIWGTPTIPTPQPPAWGVYCVEIACSRRHIITRWSNGTVQVHDSWPAVLPPNPHQLEPGTTYQRIAGGFDMVTAIVGPTSTYTGFASGCAGSLPTSRIIPRDTPKLGHTLQLRLDRLPLHHAYLGFGWQRLNTPINLVSLGMPGCAAHIAFDAVAPVFGQNQQASFALPIPSHPSMLGLRFHHQAIVPDTGANNPLQAVLSDAATAVVGR
jgi:hypothetical protein